MTDWDLHSAYAFVARRSVLEWGEFPAWNPYQCGGMSLAGNPQARFLSPTFLFHLFFETPSALRLECISHLIVAMFGTWLLVRRYVAGKAGPILAALMYAFCGGYFLRIAGAHFTFLSFSLSPWLFWLHLLARSDRRCTLFGAAVLAVMIFDGLTYPVPLTLMAIGLHAAIESVERRTPEPLVRIGAVVGVGSLLAGAKLLPVLETLRLFPRPMSAAPPPTATLVWHALFDRSQGISGALPFEGREALGAVGWWGEFGFYLGYPVIALAITGAIAFRRYLWKEVLVVLLLVFVYVGDFGALSPWHLLRKVPPFHAFEFSTRFAFPILLFLVLFAAAGIHSLEIWLGRRTRRASWIVFGLTIAIGADLFMQSTIAYLELVFWELPPRRVATEFKQARIGKGITVAAIASNLGSVDCYESLLTLGSRSSVRGVDDEEYQGEVYVPNGDGRARIVSRSTNQIEVDVNAARPTRVVVNQNDHPGWTVNGRHAIEGRHGLQSFVATSGRHVLRYEPMPLRVGVVLSSLAWAGWLVAVMFWARLASKRRWLALLGPPLCVTCAAWMYGLAVALSAKPLWTDRPIRPVFHDPARYVGTAVGTLRHAGEHAEAERLLALGRSAMPADQILEVARVVEANLRKVEGR